MIGIIVQVSFAFPWTLWDVEPYDLTSSLVLQCLGVYECEVAFAPKGCRSSVSLHLWTFDERVESAQRWIPFPRFER